ncbi:FAD-binding oxidoreductase [Chloroflexales bacterium ZM16-3]|nr:FAD-binding oxidoreductase [Chloroflexales bacterium ZM16-3]
MKPLLSQITSIVGESYVIESPADYPAYAVQGRTPALVVAPGSAEELAHVVATAYAAGVAVVPRGGGTMQPWGHPPVGDFLVVQTTRLNRVRTYEPDDLTISVEAGMTMEYLDETLAPNGQMLPLDVPIPARSTIGGILATAMDGPRRLGYGTSRDLLIGVQVVEASGRTSKAGGMVVKNVSGFDMMKLYTGSLGSLAIIVSANFKLIPRARAAATIACAFGSQAAAFALARAIHESQLVPVAVEYLFGPHPQPLSLSGRGESTPPSPARGEGGWGGEGSLLVVRAEGLPAAVERHVRDVSAMAERAGASGVTVMRDAAHESVWEAINNLPQSALVDGDELLLRLSCLPASLERALADAESLAARHGLGMRVAARALSGLAYLRVRGDDAGAQRQFHADLLGRWTQLALLAGPPALKAEVPIWGTEIPNLSLVRRIKQEFDPENRLNPGRYVV